MTAWIKRTFWKCYNNRVLRYIFYGGLTTLVNLAVYYGFRLLFQVPLLPANTVSVITAILFAYFVNSRFVFEAKASDLRERAGQFIKFISARISTMVIEVGGVWLMAEVLRMNDLIAKVIIQVVIMVLNYIFSKFLVFTHRESSQAEGRTNG